MSWISLLYKDLREHTLSLMSLAIGFVLVLLVAFLQQSTGAFNLSTFQVVRFSLITIIPLIAFIVGNRLIVREYIGGTRKFVEALPIRNYLPLLLKYILGLVYITTLCALVVLLASALADAAEDVTSQYLMLLLMKTCAFGCLIWSVVFFVSFTGKIRLVVYFVMGLLLMYFTGRPSFDEAGFPPIALLDNDLFVFEREVIPWKDLIGTVLIAFAFVLGGFALALVNEGSMAEQLGKPVSRKDFATFALLGLGGLTVFTTLQKTWETESYSLSGESVLRSETAELAVSYVESRNEPKAQQIIDVLSQRLTHLQTSIGLDRLPQVQIALNTELERTEVEPQVLDGVFVTANFSDYDDFEAGLLNSVAMHHLLLILTGNRWDYETRHWLLDGLARWWSEGGEAAASSSNNPELFALAWITKERMESDVNPLLAWQTVTDQHGFEGADALSYTAMLYLESTEGAESILRLTADYINEDVGSTSLESVKRFFNQDTVRFKRITGLDLESFTSGYMEWLDAAVTQPEIAEFIDAMPRLTGEIVSVFDASGGHRLEASYQMLEPSSTSQSADTLAAASQAAANGMCVLRHQPAPAFAQESMIYTRERDRAACTTGEVVHSVFSPYAKGDNVYGLLEFESDKFHRPIPIWVGRIHVQ